MEEIAHKVKTNALFLAGGLISCNGYETSRVAAAATG